MSYDLVTLYHLNTLWDVYIFPSKYFDVMTQHYVLLCTLLIPLLCTPRIKKFIHLILCMYALICPTILCFYRYTAESIDISYVNSNKLINQNYVLTNCNTKVNNWEYTSLLNNLKDVRSQQCIKSNTNVTVPIYCMKTNSDNQTTIQYDIYSDVDWRYFIDYYPSCERYIDKNIIGPCIQRNHNDNKDYWCKSNRYLLEEFTNNLILHMNNESKPIIFNMITYKESYNQVFTKFIDKGTFMGYTYKSDLIIFENITNIVNMSIMIFIVNALLILI